VSKQRLLISHRAAYKNLVIHFHMLQRARFKLDELRALIEQVRLKPVIDAVFPLCEVAQAHQRLEQGGVRGKIVLQVVRESNER